ncbi:MAG: hypothetical protein LKG21_03340 [Ruminococcus sp.]|jgi:Tfp pilus assembly protein PilO|nr:hypothetical protein [Ruminococcus sp.]
MKLNYRDRIIAMVLIAIVILIGGFFGLIRPKSKDITESQAARTQKQEEWDALDQKIKQNPILEKAIMNTYEDSQKLVADFPAEQDFAYQLDQYMQPIMDKCNLQVSDMEAGDSNTTTLNYYFVTPKVLDSALIDAADINGKKAEAANAKTDQNTVLSERTAETVISRQYGVTVKGTKQNLWKFLDEMKNLNKAIVIESVSINDYKFNTPDEAKLEFDKATGLPTNADPTIVDEGYSSITLVIDFYSVSAMEKPDVK